MFVSAGFSTRYARAPNVKTFPNANRFQSPRFFSRPPFSLSFFQPPRKLHSRPPAKPSGGKKPKRVALAERLSFRVVAGNARAAPLFVLFVVLVVGQKAAVLFSSPLQNPIPPLASNRETSAVDSPGRGGGGALVNDRSIIASCSFAAKNHRLSSPGLAARRRSR